MMILLFTGLSGAGKTTICRNVSISLGIPHLSEREIARSIAKEDGFKRSRHWVEKVGRKRAVIEIRKRTTDTIKASARGTYALILDGAYDMLLLRQIQQLVEVDEIEIIGVVAPRELRIARCAERMQVDLETAEKEMNFLDDFKHEVGGDELLAKATLLIHNTGSIIDACNTAIAAIVSMADHRH